MEAHGLVCFDILDVVAGLEENGRAGRGGINGFLDRLAGLDDAESWDVCRRIDARILVYTDLGACALRCGYFKLAAIRIQRPAVWKLGWVSADCDAFAVFQDGGVTPGQVGILRAGEKQYYGDGRCTTYCKDGSMAATRPPTDRILVLRMKAVNAA